MRTSLTLFFLLFFQFEAKACTENLKIYPDECQGQDRFLKLSEGFQTASINMLELKGYEVPKALGKMSYFQEKNDILTKGQKALDKNNKWQEWQRGQIAVNDLNVALINLDDILKLHRTMFASRSLFDNAGKLRTHNAEVNPKIHFSCEDKALNNDLYKLLFSFDLSSIEGYPLLVLQNVSLCPDKQFRSADVLFYKGASVKLELNRWVIELNDMINRYESGNAPADYSPLKYMADMRRWFLAIRPFNEGNDEVVMALMDYTTRRLNLPPLPLLDPVSPVFKSVEENREQTKKAFNEALNFFEGCLFETKTKLVSLECTNL